MSWELSLLSQLILFPPKMFYFIEALGLICFPGIIIFHFQRSRVSASLKP